MQKKKKGKEKKESKARRKNVTKKVFSDDAIYIYWKSACFEKFCALPGRPYICGAGGEGGSCPLQEN